MGLWRKYLNEVGELGKKMEEGLEMIMGKGVGMIWVVMMGGIVEEVVLGGGIEGDLVGKWKDGGGGMVVW